jgi:hypothetical protein
MSAIQIPNFNPNSSQPRMIAVLGDVVDLTPFDGRFAYEYAVASAPGGSTATFSGPLITPDLAGAYSLTVTAGADVLAVPLFVFASSVFATLANYPTRAGTRPDAERRQILKGVANALPIVTLVAWNAGTFPPGLDSRFMQFGGAL